MLAVEIPPTPRRVAVAGNGIADWQRRELFVILSRADLCLAML